VEEAEIVNGKLQAISGKGFLRSSHAETITYHLLPFTFYLYCFFYKTFTALQINSTNVNRNFHRQPSPIIQAPFMRTLFTLLILSTIFFSCHNDHREPQPTPDTPKALQPAHSTSSSLSKRYESSDLVNELYAELAAKDPALKELEKQIDDFYGSDADSLADFSSFDQRNNDYYNTTTGHYRLVQDSSIRQRMTALISASQSEYNKRILVFKALITQIGQKKTNLNDLHELLKIVKTLPAINKYQLDNEPSSKPAEQVLQELNKIVLKTEAIVNK